MLSPLVSMAFCWASALNIKKLLGAVAAENCSTENCKRALVLASVCAASTKAIKVRVLSKYTAAVKAAMGLCDHASLAKRRSLSLGFSCRLWFHNSVACAM